MSLKVALNVDPQNDFFDGGALETKGSVKIIPSMNRLTVHAGIHRRNWVSVFSADKHPGGPNNKHFDRWSGYCPGGIHCVDGTIGAKFHPELFVPDWIIELHKGLGKEDDGYSPFDQKNVRLVLPIGNHKYTLHESLGPFLRSLDAKEVYVYGLTLPYCPTSAALGSLEYKFKTYLVEDATGCLDPDGKDEAVQKLKDAGVIITTTDEVLRGGR